MVQGVFNLWPPEILKERPETCGGFLHGDAVGKDAVHVVVSIDEARS